MAKTKGKTEEVTRVPKTKVGQVVQDYRDDGAVSVQAWEAPKGSGKYTVRAVYPAK